MNSPCTSSSSYFRRPNRGMTLIELTVVILVMLSLVTLLFIGAQAWKQGSDRSNCILQLRQVQMAVRSYANLNEHDPGADVSPANLKASLIGSDRYIEKAPSCPGGGSYTFGGNVVPKVGALYMTCSLSASLEHEPLDYSDW